MCALRGWASYDIISHINIRKGIPAVCRRVMDMVEKKNIALCIVFTVLSCGLYGWYWLYCLA